MNFATEFTTEGGSAACRLAGDETLIGFSLACSLL